MPRSKTLSPLLCTFLLVSVARGDQASEEARVKARDRGLAWLAKSQAADGSWGKQYTVAVTGFACLAQLAAADEPFQGNQGRRLVRGLNYLLSQQKEGMFLYMVMMKDYQFLLKITPQAISSERFPYYGHFYGTMGMRLLGQEFKSFREKTDGYIAGARKDLLAWQQEDGSWPVKAWVKNTGETDAYATAFASLTLSVPDGRLSIFNRDRPTLIPRKQPSRAAILR